MTFSGTTTFALTALQICTRAAGKCGWIDTGNGEVLNTQDLADFMLQLEVESKSVMQEFGIDLWLRVPTYLFLQQGQAVYSLGNTTSDNWTTDFFYTVTTATALTGATSITVSETSGIFATDPIGVKLDSGVTFWTTISSVAGLVVHLASSLPSQASSGNYVYSYPANSLADRPQRVLYVHKTNTSSQDIFMENISRQVYDQLPNKTQMGQPVQWHYEPTIPNGTLWIWPTSDGISGFDYITCTVVGKIQDVGVSGNNPYFPVEWCNYLIWRLGWSMSYESGVDFAERDRLKAISDEYLQKLLDYTSSSDETSIQFGMRQDAGWSFGRTSQ